MAAVPDALTWVFEDWTDELHDVVANLQPGNQLPVAFWNRVTQRLTRTQTGVALRVNVGQLVGSFLTHPPMAQLATTRLNAWNQLNLAPWPPPADVMVNVDPTLQYLVLAILPIVIGIFGHPLRGPEARTALYFQLYMLPVLGSLNNAGWLATRHLLFRGTFQVQHAFTIPAVHATGNHAGQTRELYLSGRCEFVITRDGQPFCVVELKRYPMNRDRARDQAFVYATALAHMSATRSMRAIVTDLRNWQFLRVDALSRAVSQTITLCTK